MSVDYVGAAKIKDALFVGDEHTGQDLEFIITNKVTHIINCAGKQLANKWASIGIKYLTFYWCDSETQVY